MVGGSLVVIVVSRAWFSVVSESYRLLVYCWHGLVEVSVGLVACCFLRKFTT